MNELLWLLLPVAAATGWWSGRIRSGRREPYKKNSNLREDYIKGINYLLNEQPDKALDLFIRMVDVDSETVDTHLLLASLFRKRGEVERAIRIHQNLIARPNLDARYRATALLELGKDYMHAGLLDRAESLYRELLDTGHFTVEASCELQRIYEQEKDWEKAIKYAEAALNEPAHGDVAVIAHYWCELAIKKRKEGYPRIAWSYAQHALSRDPGHVRACILLGDFSFENKNVRSSNKYYTKAIRNDVQYIPVVLPKLYEVCRFSGDRRYFIKLLTRLGVEEGHAEALIYLVRMLIESKEYSEARMLLRKGLDRNVAPLRLLREYLSLEQIENSDISTDLFRMVARTLDEYLEQWLEFQCVNCGFRSRQLFWSCPSCHNWGTIKPGSSLNRVGNAHREMVSG
ncbi:lipopolysaccharide assembly protein LapB [Acidihalobacter ferrooxydans]|uniref:Lipopolysaccharide assembly protein B n=1 Tax=Acidihalobacter ferrooxydans TaxID=1765967 RepID=A0A1P8UGC1_9GAMM|nr:lipopolysaccharide assembly protein LapB [Acidihalobacter ferrooxydans]APZ42814.1 lipopolysaccharide assembly protein LapB [Acidihalobacter ferrooxydans]